MSRSASLAELFTMLTFTYALVHILVLTSHASAVSGLLPIKIEKTAAKLLCTFSLCLSFSSALSLSLTQFCFTSSFVLLMTASGCRLRQYSLPCKIQALRPSHISKHFHPSCLNKHSHENKLVLDKCFMR